MKRSRRAEHEEDTDARKATPAPDRSPATATEAEQALSAANRGGPALRLASNDKAPADATAVAEPDPSIALRAPAGQETRHSAFATGQTVRLRGETEGTFDGGTSSIEGQRVTRAEGCENCTEGCVRVRGTLVLTYHVTTSVTLPSVSDFPNLTPCQQERVAAAIRDVLAPHEQDHVRRFETYNGTTRHPFDLKGCNADEISAQLQVIHDREAAAREAAAQALSDAIDPFHFDVDLDCEEPPASTAAPPVAGTPGSGDGGGDEEETTP